MEVLVHYQQVAEVAAAELVVGNIAGSTVGSWRHNLHIHRMRRKDLLLADLRSTEPNSRYSMSATVQLLLSQVQARMIHQSRATGLNNCHLFRSRYIGFDWHLHRSHRCMTPSVVEEG